MGLTSVAAAVVRNEPDAFGKFIEETQGRSFDELPTDEASSWLAEVSM